MLKKVALVFMAFLIIGSISGCQNNEKKEDTSQKKEETKKSTVKIEQPSNPATITVE